MTKKTKIDAPLLNVLLGKSTAPKIKEVSGQDWIIYGDNEYKNLYPQFLIDAYNCSSTHSAICNAAADMIAGKGFILEDADNLSSYVKAKKLIARANRKGDTLHDVFKKAAFDLQLQGAYALQVIWSKDRRSIVEIYHQPVEQVRAGVYNEDGERDYYYISTDWSQYRKAEYKPEPIKAFNPADNKDEPVQLIYNGLYSPGIDAYFTPDYIGALNWILTDNMISEYFYNLVSNNFSPTFWINFNNGVPSERERNYIERRINEKFTSPDAAGRVLLTFSDDKNSAPDLQAIQLSNADKQYKELSEQCIQNILTGHRLSSPMLIGIKTSGQLGGRAELMDAYELYFNAQIKPKQDLLLSSISKIMDINDANVPISVVENAPYNHKYGVDILKEVLTVDELRAELGYAPLEKKELEEDKKKKQYMSSEEHECTHLSSPLDDKKAIEIIESLEVENEYDLIDEWDLVSEEELDEELINTEMAVNTGSIVASGKAATASTDTELYKIRYVYRGGKILDTSRDFCKHMITKHYGSLFTRGDIQRMSNASANGDFGNYDIFEFKGSYNCRHYWLRRLYVLKKAPRKMEIDGVVYKKGDYLPTDKLSNYYPRNKGYVPADAGVPKLSEQEKAANKINKKVVK